MMGCNLYIVPLDEILDDIRTEVETLFVWCRRRFEGWVWDVAKQRLMEVVESDVSINSIVDGIWTIYGS